jgi:hypothetical protein
VSEPKVASEPILVSEPKSWSEPYTVSEPPCLSEPTPPDKSYYVIMDNSDNYPIAVYLTMQEAAENFLPNTRIVPVHMWDEERAKR